jgi:hypothetical protein
MPLIYLPLIMFSATMSLFLDASKNPDENSK